MCLITLRKNKDIKLDLTKLKSSIETNTDGTGIMFTADGRLQIKKFLGSVDGQHEFQTKLIEDATMDKMAIHHRKRTHGAISPENTHPYKILSKDDGDAKDLYLMHNGIISGLTTHNNMKDGESDTAIFVKEFLVPMFKDNPDLANNATFMNKFVSAAIGSGSKLLLMDNEGNHWIVNEDKGVWQNDIWYSNTYSFTPVYTGYAYYTGNKAWQGANADITKKKEESMVQGSYLSTQKSLPRPSSPALLTQQNSGAVKTLASVGIGDVLQELGDSLGIKIVQSVFNIYSYILTDIDSKALALYIKSLSSQDARDNVIQSLINTGNTHIIFNLLKEVLRYDDKKDTVTVSAIMDTEGDDMIESSFASCYLS